MTLRPSQGVLFRFVKGHFGIASPLTILICKKMGKLKNKIILTPLVKKCIMGKMRKDVIFTRQEVIQWQSIPGRIYWIL